MIPKEIIELSIEGGWNPNAYCDNIDSQPIITDRTKLKPDVIKVAVDFLAITWAWQQIALDPDFWQALGKALGHGEAPFNRRVCWDDLTCRKGCQWIADGEGCSDDLRPGTRIPIWQFHALRFYDLILTGYHVGQLDGSPAHSECLTSHCTVKFWQEIINSKK